MMSSSPPANSAGYTVQGSLTAGFPPSSAELKHSFVSVAPALRHP